MTARDLRDRIAAAAATAHPSTPLRILARRRAPLVSQGQQLGYMEALLRLSLRGSGEGEGVLVFDWPTTAASHSAVQILERWSEKCDETGRARVGALEVESRSQPIERNGAPPLPGIHLKIHFTADRMPDELLELLGLAARLGMDGAVAKEVAAYRPPAESAGTAEEPAPIPEPAPEPAAAATHPEQDKVDRIQHHADYDPAIHPRANPNDEVTTTEGDTFRLVIRRSGGAMRRQWVRIGRSVAQHS